MVFAACAEMIIGGANVHRLRNMACVRTWNRAISAWSPPRPWRPSCCANGAASPARPPVARYLFDFALVSDDTEPRDSVNSLTAFASNSGVYLVPFAMVPSSPIKLTGKCEQNPVHITHIPSQERLFLRDISCESEVGGEKLHVSMPAWLEGIMAPRQTKAKLTKRKTGKPMLDWILKHG